MRGADVGQVLDSANRGALPRVFTRPCSLVPGTTLPIDSCYDQSIQPDAEFCPHVRWQSNFVNITVRYFLPELVSCDRRKPVGSGGAGVSM